MKLIPALICSFIITICILFGLDMKVSSPAIITLFPLFCFFTYGAVGGFEKGESE